MTAGTVTVTVVDTAPRCGDCQRPLHYKTSLDTGYCCHCRNDHSDHRPACQLCTTLLARSEEPIGLCIPCQVIR